MQIRNILILVLVSVSSLLSAQFAHVNSALLLSESAEIKAADSQLVEFQKQLESDFQKEGETFQKEYQAFMAKANSGDYSQVALQQEQATLQQKQQKLQSMQAESQQKILIKREELYAPILKKIEDVVAKVAKEKGYKMVFDASIGSVLYGLDSNDITNDIKSRL